jgi:hypothetical protein
VRLQLDKRDATGNETGYLGSYYPTALSLLEQTARLVVVDTNRR